MSGFAEGVCSLVRDMVKREEETVMFTRDFRETVRARARRDPEFRGALLREGIACLLAGEVETGVVVLRDYIAALDRLVENRLPKTKWTKGL